MKNSIYARLVVLLGLLLLPGFIWAQEPVLLTNSSVAGNRIDSSVAQKIFLGKKSVWENGDKVIPAVLAGGEVHRTFLKKVVGKTPAQFSTHWKRIIFTGRGQAPKSFRSEEDLARFVARTKGAIGYVGAGTASMGAKVTPLK